METYSFKALEEAEPIIVEEWLADAPQLRV